MFYSSAHVLMDPGLLLCFSHWIPCLYERGCANISESPTWTKWIYIVIRLYMSPPPKFICWRLSLQCNNVEAEWEVFRWWEHCACIRIDGLIKRTVWSRGGQKSLLCPTLGHIMTRSEGPCGSWPLSSTSQIPRLWGKHYFLNKLSSLRYSIIAT